MNNCAIILSRLTLTLLFVGIGCGTTLSFQLVGGRDNSVPPAPSKTPTSSPKPSKPKSGSKKPSSAKPSSRTTSNNPPNANAGKPPPDESAATAPLATLTVFTNPPGAAISIDGRAIEARDPDGALRLSGVKAGKLELVTSRQDYREDRRTVTLTPGQVESLTIDLEPLPGKINVTPNVTGTQITVNRASDGAEIGTYVARVLDLDVPAGDYQIVVAKPGYVTATREIKVEPAKTAYLEPLLELAPIEHPRLSSDPNMTWQYAKEGKFVILTLFGRSGDSTNSAGSVDVVLDPEVGSTRQATITGLLSGFPCQVEFLRIENIADFSFVEPPGAANEWRTVVVRVRPKDDKRPLHFSITWSLIQGISSAGSVDSDSLPLEPTIVRSKASPVYPAPARDSGAKRTVIISGPVDKGGNVVSAKAVDGPRLLWASTEDAAKRGIFPPARRSGQPVSKQIAGTIQFPTVTANAVETTSPSRTIAVQGENHVA